MILNRLSNPAKKNISKQALATIMTVICVLLLTSIVGATGNGYEAAQIDWRQAKGAVLRVPMQTHPSTTAIKAFVPEFEELTGITVKIEELDWSILHEKILADFQTGAGTYDVVMHGWYTAPLYAKSEWVEDLRPWLANPKLTDQEWFDIEDLFKPARALLEWDGGVYGLPVYAQSDVLYYRKDLYEEYGLSVPETFEEYLSNAKKLHKPPFQIGVAMRGSKDQAPPVWFMYLRGFGGEYLDADWKPAFNNEIGVRALTEYAETLMTAGPKGVASWGFPEITQAFGAGQVVHTLESSPFAPDFEAESSPVRGKVGYAPIPKGPEGRGASVFCMSMAMNSRSKQKDAAWLFMQWVTSKELSKKSTLLQSRGDSPRRSTWSDPEVVEKWTSLGLKEWAQATLDTMPLAIYPGNSNPADRTFEPRFPEYLQTREALGVAISSVLSGASEPEEALDKAAQSVYQILKEAGYYE